jgi:hypothetical protein
MVYCLHSGVPCWTGNPGVEGGTMTENTCAACDCPLDESSIKVTVGGRTVEVCCEDCARKLNEAHASAIAPRR